MALAISRAEKGVGRLDQRNEFGVPCRQAARQLACVEHIGDDHQVLGAFDLGAHQGGDLRVDRRLDIAKRAMPGAVEAHEDVGTALAGLARGRRQ